MGYIQNKQWDTFRMNYGIQTMGYIQNEQWDTNNGIHSGIHSE